MREGLAEKIGPGGLIPPGSRVLVGFSGGADSACLLLMLHELGVDVCAAHLNHGQRPEAEAEADRCRDLCADRGIPFLAARGDIPLMSRELKIGLEEAGRRARYAFLDRAAEQAECGLIATAHTQDDQVETVLFNAVRGSGLAGIAGIPERRGRIIRPLLHASRAETEAFCRLAGWEPVRDPSNTDPAHSRARIRAVVLPELEAAHPGARASLLRLAETARAEDEFLNGMAAAALESCEISLNGALRWLTLDAEAAFDRLRFLRLPPVLQARGARLAASALGGAFDHRQTEALLSGLAAGAKGSVTGEEGAVIAEWDESRLHIRLADLPEPFRHPLPIPGAIESDSFGWALEAWVEADGEPFSPDESAPSIRIAAAGLKGGLHFRSAQEGESMRPAGRGGSRLISDLLSELKITRLARRRLPLVCDMAGPIWIPGGPGDERAVPNEDSARHVILRLRPLHVPEGS